MTENDTKWGRILFHAPPELNYTMSDIDWDDEETRENILRLINNRIRHPVGFFTTPEAYDEWREEVVGSYDDVPFLPEGWELDEHEIIVDEGPINIEIDSHPILIPDGATEEEIHQSIVDEMNWREENT